MYNKRNMGGAGGVMCEYLWILNAADKHNLIFIRFLQFLLIAMPATITIITITTTASEAVAVTTVMLVLWLLLLLLLLLARVLIFTYMQFDVRKSIFWRVLNAHTYIHCKMTACLCVIAGEHIVPLNWCDCIQICFSTSSFTSLKRTPNSNTKIILLVLCRR